MTELNTPVPGEGTSTSVSPETPGAGGVANATPSTPPRDAETLAAEVAKYRDDLNRMKSTFQRREHETKREAQEREEQMLAELDRVRRSLLDDDELAAYEKEHLSGQVNRYQQQLSEMQSQLEREQMLRNAVTAFADRGVPMEVLLPASAEGNLESLSQSAWDWLFAERSRLMEATKSAAAKPPSTPPPTPPATSTDSSQAPYAGPTWSELVAKYGSEETVYSLVEAGRIPATIIPGAAKA